MVLKQEVLHTSRIRPILIKVNAQGIFANYFAKTINSRTKSERTVLKHGAQVNNVLNQG